MAKPLTNTERQAIIDALNAGTPYAQIVKTTGRGKSTISRIAKEIGHQAGRSNLARAQESRSAYTAERRAKIAERLTEEAERLLDELRKPWLAYNIGGKDNTFTGKVLPEPSTTAKRELIQAIRDATRTVIDIDRHDNRADEGGAAVDDWLRDMIGSAK